MKVASFNVNSIRARLPIITDWLDKQSPDVLAVQETKVQDQDFPTEAFDAIGYQCTFRGQKSYNGVAFLSRIEASNVDAGFPDEPHDEPRLLRATFDGLTIVNTYIPQGQSPDSDKFQYKLQWFQRLAAYFRDNFKPTDPVLWLGDFNVAPEPIDVHDPETLLGHVCFRPESPRCPPKHNGLGLHRHIPKALPGTRVIHVLGLPSRQCVRAKPRMASGPSHGHRARGSEITAMLYR